MAVAAVLVIVETVDLPVPVVLVPVLVLRGMATPQVAVARVPITAQVAADLTAREGQVQVLLER